MKAAESRFNACLYFSSNALARKMERLAAKAWKPLGLSPSHAYLLLLVLDRPGVQPTFISEQLLLAPSTVTRLIEKLEKQGLVYREAQGKETHVYPTPKALSMKPRMEQCVEVFNGYCQDGNDAAFQLTQSIVTAHDNIRE